MKNNRRANLFLGSRKFGAHQQSLKFGMHQWPGMHQNWSIGLGANYCPAKQHAHSPWPIAEEHFYFVKGNLSQKNGAFAIPIGLKNPKTPSMLFGALFLMLRPRYLDR